MKSIQGYLGDDYEVLSSVGHIRDLASKKEIPADKKAAYGKYSIDVENDFDPFYVVNDRKTKTVAELKRALKTADEVLLANDGDREGEAIAWHLLEVLKPKVPVRRMIFHEITKDAIKEAAEHTRSSTSRSSTPRRPAASSTACTDGTSRRCCGARSVPAARARRSAPAACSPPPRAWSWSASASAWRSSPRPTGTSKPSPRSPVRPSPRASIASTAPPSPAVATTTTTVS